MSDLPLVAFGEDSDPTVSDAKRRLATAKAAGDSDTIRTVKYEVREARRRWRTTEEAAGRRNPVDPLIAHLNWSAETGG